MNFKKITKIAGTIFGGLSILSLALPVYNTYVEGGESMDLTISGYNLAEFSVWGIFVLLIPLIFIVLMHSSIRDTLKSIFCVLMYSLGMISINSSVRAAREWIAGIATGEVYLYSGIIIYTVLLFASAVCYYLSCIYRKKES